MAVEKNGVSWLAVPIKGRRTSKQPIAKVIPVYPDEDGVARNDRQTRILDKLIHKIVLLIGKPRFVEARKNQDDIIT